jgi:hypothetical protein
MASKKEFLIFPFSGSFSVSDAVEEDNGKVFLLRWMGGVVYRIFWQSL